MTRPAKLEYTNRAGTGPQIHAYIPFKANCIEFTLKDGWQPILIGYAPWIQFEDPKYSELVETVFKDMVELWNNKFAKENKDD